MRAVNVINTNNLYNTILYKYTTMPKGRTGIIPGKKNFTAVGGVGAKRISTQNSINSKALAPTSNIASIGIASILSPSAPPPPIIPTAVIAAIETAKNPPPPIPPTPAPILFDLDSITKRSFNFRGDGSPYLIGSNGPPGPHEPIPDRYLNGMVRAVKRWSRFLAFNSSTANTIRNVWKTRWWNGLTLANLKIIPVEKVNYIMKCEAICHTNTCFNYGYKLTVNTLFTEKKGDSYTEEHLFHVFTHELGHALGMPVFIPNKKNGTGYDYILESIRDPIMKINVYPEYHLELDPESTDPRRPYKRVDDFKNATAAYAKYNGIKMGDAQTNPKLLATVKLIPLEEDKCNHWNTEKHLKKVDLNPDGTRFMNITYCGVHNDLMVPNWSKDIDLKSKYLISGITIGVLLDMYSEWGGIKFFNYYELNKGANEVTKDDVNNSVIKFEGVIAGSKQIKNFANKSVKAIPNPNDSKFITHGCECKPIFITDLSELEYCV
jgi:hypothetical protein